MTTSLTHSTSGYADGDSIPGTVYRVVRKLGAAGLGAVYEVEDTTTERRYCLKTLDSVTGDLDEFRRRLALEAQILARLAHPNIVQVITAGVTEDRRLPYFVMELLRGRTLRETLDAKGALETSHVLDIACQVLDALEHAHDRGVIHRDVKPENIFLHRPTPDVAVQAKLLDFGVVAFLRGMPGVDDAPGLSPKYAAPELLEDGPASPASDLYSMGLVIYEMLCGHGPFDQAGDLADIARARLTHAPAPFTVQVPIVLEDLVICALERDPTLRPADAFSFGETLRVLGGRISRLPQSSLLSSQPPPSGLPSISGIPNALVAELVESDWRPPPTPRSSEVDEVLDRKPKASNGRSAKPNVTVEGEPNPSDAPARDSRPSRPSRAGRERIDSTVVSSGVAVDTLVGVAVGLALLLITLFVVMLK